MQTWEEQTWEEPASEEPACLLFSSLCAWALHWSKPELRPQP